MLANWNANPFRAAKSTTSVLARALLVAVAGGLVTGLGLTAAIAAGNDFSLGRDVLVLSGYLVALYTSVHVVGLGALAVVLLLLGLRPGARVFLAAMLSFYMLLNGLLRFYLSVQLFSVTPFLSAVGAIDLVVVAVVALLTALAILAKTLQRAVQSAVVAAALLSALWSFQVWHERPFVRDLSESIPPLLASTQPAAPAAAAERFENAKLVVLGFDGLSWEVLTTLLKLGELPHFRELLEGAAYGQLATLPFTVSPVIWETISTGQSPEHHGIGYHVHYEFPGMRERVRRLPNFQLGNTPMGLRRLLTYLQPVAPWRGVPADATDARVARFWEIASRSGITVGVYNWLNTGPAVPVDGFLHAYGVTPPLDYPPDLQVGLPPLSPPDVPVADGKTWVAANLDFQRASYERFVLLARRFQPQLLMFYTHTGDGVNHLNWKRDVVGDGLFFSGFLRRPYVPGERVTEANRALDEIVGDVLSRTPADVTIAVVSDHGFGYRGYEHDNGPPGVLILRGPGVRPGVFTGAKMADVTPTLLHLLGLAVADDIQGRPLAIALPGGPLDRPVRRIASYGPSATHGAHANKPEPGALRHQQEYLRSLGYVN